MYDDLDSDDESKGTIDKDDIDITVTYDAWWRSQHIEKEEKDYGEPL